MREDKELVKLILNDHENNLTELLSSKAYGWVNRFRSMSPGQIKSTLKKLDLPEYESAVLECFGLESILGDIDEHEEYSEYADDEDWIKDRINELTPIMKKTAPYEWGYLYKLAKEVRSGNMNFTRKAMKEINGEKQLEFMTEIDDAKRAEKLDIVLGIKDFTGFNKLMDEAILFEISSSIYYAALNSSSDEEKMEGEKSFCAFEHYVKNRGLPKIFGPYIIEQAILMAAKWGNVNFLYKVSYYIDKIEPNVNTYTYLSHFYAALNDRENLIKNLKLSKEYGSDGDFMWIYHHENTKDDDEIKALESR